MSKRHETGQNGPGVAFVYIGIEYMQIDLVWLVA